MTSNIPYHIIVFFDLCERSSVNKNQRSYFSVAFLLKLLATIKQVIPSGKSFYRGYSKPSLEFSTECAKMTKLMPIE